MTSLVMLQPSGTVPSRLLGRIITPRLSKDAQMPLVTIWG